MPQRTCTRLLHRILPLLAFGLFLAPAPASAQTPLPASPGAPRVGEKAPDFTLADTAGKPVSLASLLKPAESGEKPWVLLVFYRGYW